MIFGVMSLEELGQHRQHPQPRLDLRPASPGLAMVFSILGLVNFAHGGLVTVAGYTFYLLNERGAPFSCRSWRRWSRRWSRPC